MVLEPGIFLRYEDVMKHISLNLKQAILKHISQFCQVNYSLWISLSLH